MTTPPGSPSVDKIITLNIDFSGLCLFVSHQETDGEVDPAKTAVLLPDARLTTGNTNVLQADGPKLVHRDGTPAQPHVGFLRVRLANLIDSTQGTSAAPECDVIHRLDRESIQIRAKVADGKEPARSAEDAAAGLDLVPDLKEFAVCLEPDPETLGASPPASVLARMYLPGGSFQGTPSSMEWKIERALLPFSFPGDAPKPNYVKNFGKTTRWTQTFKGDSLTILLKSLDTAAPRKVVLFPAPANDAREITIEIANLCCDNLFGFEELGDQELADPGPDEDFKWFYQLLSLRKNQTHLGLNFRASLPRPVPVSPAEGGAEGDLQGCTSLRSTGNLNALAGNAE